MTTVATSPTTQPTAPATARPAGSATAGLYVQYGCGLCAPAGWANFDVSPTLRLQRLPLVGKVVPGPKFPPDARYGDVVKGLPVPDASVDAAYCSHTLEHLSLDDARTALRNTLRVLKPGGTFRFVLPDLRFLAEQYVASRSPDAAIAFMEGSYLGERRRPRGLGGLARAWVGNSDHRWMWDYESMERELVRAGFAAVRRAACGDSPDPMFAAVEDPARWENCLGVDCRRPAA